MEKIIKIGEKEVLLKANAMNALIYRSNFGNDIFTDEAKIVSVAKDENYGEIEIVKLMQIVWTMAKAADSKTEPFNEWVSNFEEFPVFDVLTDIIELILMNFSSKTNIKNSMAAVKK